MQPHPLSGSSASNAALWLPDVRPADTPRCPAPASATGAPRLSYSAQEYHSHAEFQLSKAFEQYKYQVWENLSFLTAFCQHHKMPDAAAIGHDFDVFFNHRFDEHHYFRARTEIVDSIGKRSLDDFCSMIGDETIDLEKRKTAIRTLSQGMTADAESVVSNLTGAARVLAEAAGGLRGKLWELKEEAAKKVLSHVVRERLGHEPDYPKNSVYYLRTAESLLADHLGLKTKPAYSMQLAAINRDSEFMSVCKARLGAALTPDRLCYRIAEQCQEKFNSRLSTGPQPSTGIWNEDTANQVRQILQEMSDDLGLRSEDQLSFNPERKDWMLRESDLRLKSFLKFEEEEFGPAPTYRVRLAASDDRLSADRAYSLRTDPTLIAVDILGAMRDLKLLAEESRPLNCGEWTQEENEARVAIFSYGDLTWTARVPPGKYFEEPVWESEHVAFDLVALLDVLQWKATGNDIGSPLPAAAIRQAIRSTDAAQLEGTRAHWLEDVEGIWQLLGGMDADEAEDYLVKSLSYLGAGYSDAQRTDLRDRVAQMGIGDAVVALNRRWFSDPMSRSA